MLRKLRPGVALVEAADREAMTRGQYKESQAGVLVGEAQFTAEGDRVATSVGLSGVTLTEEERQTTFSCGVGY